MHKATTRECRFLSNHHASVFLNATEDQVLSCRIGDLAEVLLLVLGELFTTTVGYEAEALQVERDLLELLNMLPVYGGIWGRRFAIPSQGLVRHRGLVQQMSSKQGE